MKKVLVFEHTEYNKSLEKDFYHFCLKRQLSLSRYMITYLLYSFLYFFRIISKRKYYENRWSFLCNVHNIEAKINSFWKSKKRKLAGVAVSGEIVWISEYPEILLRDLAKQNNTVLLANEYDILTKTFLKFEDVYHLYRKIDANEKVQIFDKFHSKLKSTDNSEFIIIYNQKLFNSSAKYLLSKILNICYTCIVLLIMGICLGLVSLYFGAAYYIMPMFLSYFKVAYLPLLNILPIVFCMFFFYLVFNRIWVSFLVTAAITLVLTWINYFKLVFRNDPLLAADFTLLSETINMAGKYDVRPNWKIICVVIACILGIVAAFFLAKGKIRSPKIRLVGLAVLAFAGVYFFNNTYMDSKLYASTENYALISRWSATQLYISKGFVYPFIYSIKSNRNEPPAGYNEKAAKDKLYSFDYSDIPDAKKVNVVSVMLEAYNDFSRFDQLEFNVDVYKYLHQLESESYSGELVTNIFAGGTVNTEWSFLTGYTSLYNFRGNTNSYARYFEEQGYTTEGSHPSYDWFYNRKNINEYLGFKNYYFLENYYAKLANGLIARDNILFPQIVKLYEANKKTSTPYFSFNVTYQNHGPYSAENLTDVQYVKNKGYTDAEYNIMNNYFSGIYSTTQELKTLIDHFRAEDQPVVVILFGDHNPWMGDNNSVYTKLGIDFDLGTEKGFYNYFDTPYIIWGNESAKKTLGNDLKGKGPKIGPYFLMNEFFNLAGYEGNEFMKLSNDLKTDVDVVHTKNRYKEADVLTSKLSPQSQQKLNDFLQAQYYWRTNFRNSPKK